ncbi:MAG: carboxypeptidase regulatory-like domain-containing protein [Candidatus Sulfotelmatobacter sp.]
MNSRSSQFANSLVVAARARSRCLAVLGVFLLGLSFPALGQEATILGTVTDPSGSVMQNVKIRITHVETGEVRSIVTNETGQYVAADLPIGHYNVSAQTSGFKLAEHKQVVLNVADRARVDFQMQLGSTTETVTVEANAVRVQTDTGEVSGVVTGQQISQLATNGRNVFALEALTPGATSIQADFQVPTSSGGDFNVSFNGQRVSHNLWLVDGGEAADRGGGGGAIVLPSEDAIEEFRTMTSNYSAEYGLSSAGTISLAIKSGTSKFHATAFYFGRYDWLDARNFFNPAPEKVAELRLHDFGFNVGGPVALHEGGHPKTFFFYNMEWRRYIQGGIFNQTVPYPTTYGGSFASNLPANSNDPATGNAVPNSGLHVPCASQLSPALITDFNKAGITTFSTPSSNGACAIPSASQEAAGATLPVFQPFPGNAIPSGLLDSNAQLLLKAGIFPAPTSGDTFIGGNRQPTTGKEEIARIDHQFTERFSIFGHFIADQALQTYGTTQWSSDNVPTVANTYGNPSYSFVVHATNSIRPNLLNEIGFSYDGNRIHILPLGIYTQPQGFSVPQVFTIAVYVDIRIPDIHLAGSTGTFYQVNWLPWNNTANDYQVRDDLSWTRGAHQFKIGGSWALYKKSQDYFAETQGGFGFNGFYTGNDFADYLIGYAQSYNENAYKGTGYWNAISPAAYFQDNWRATRRLTLNLGLRWDGIPHTYEANENQSNFYPNLYDPANAPTWVAGSNFGQISPTSPGVGPGPSSIPQLSPYSFYLNGMGIGGKNGNPSGLADNAWWNFGPRVGFAYDLTGSGKTVIRGGYGLMYERIQGNDMYNGATNPPFGDSYNTNNVLFSNPAQNIPTGATVTTSTIPIVPGSVTGINKYYPAPRTSQYSAGVQQALGSRTVLSVSYVGSLDRHESYWQETNLPPYADLPALQGGTSTTPFNGLVPYQGYTQLKMAYNGANSHYNSLQVELHGQIRHDLTLQAAYTLSRAIDPSTGQNGGNNGWDLSWITNPYAGWKYDVGPSVLDRTDVFFVNFVYNLPFLKNASNHFLRTAVGGWELSGIVTAESGQPYNLAINGTNVASVFPGGDLSNRPDLTGSLPYTHTKVIGSNGTVTGLQWINPAAFSTPAAGTWGNFPFDGVRGPGRDNWNLALFKNFVISEARGSSFQFRAESFNTWNHTQFGGSGQNGGFSNNFGASNFGQLTSAFDPRVFQLGAKLIF